MYNQKVDKIVIRYILKKKMSVRASKVRYYLVILAFTALALSAALFLWVNPQKGAVSSHSAVVVLFWLFVASVTMLARGFASSEKEYSHDYIIKSAALSLIGSFPIPAILFLLPYGGVETGDIVAVVAISSLAYVYASMTLRFS